MCIQISSLPGISLGNSSKFPKMRCRGGPLKYLAKPFTDTLLLKNLNNTIVIAIIQIVIKIISAVYYLQLTKKLVFDFSTYTKHNSIQKIRSSPRNSYGIIHIYIRTLILSIKRVYYILSIRMIRFNSILVFVLITH